MFRIDGKYIHNDIIEKFSPAPDNYEDENIYFDDKISNYTLLEIPININYDTLSDDEKITLKETIIQTVCVDKGYSREDCEINIIRIVSESYSNDKLNELTNSSFKVQVKIRNKEKNMDEIEKEVVKDISNLNIDDLDYQNIGQFNKDSHSNICVDDTCLSIEQLSRLKNELKKYKCLIPN